MAMDIEVRIDIEELGGIATTYDRDLVFRVSPNQPGKISLCLATAGGEAATFVVDAEELKSAALKM